MINEERERLIKKDLESVENRIRHAYNQGFEMGMKAERKRQGTEHWIDDAPTKANLQALVRVFIEDNTNSLMFDYGQKRYIVTVMEATE